MSEVVFFNVWHADSKESQESLLGKMRAEASKLALKPGFLGLAAWRGQQDHRVLVQARWASEDHFRKAVSESAEAQTARADMERLGTAEPGLFEESLAFGCGDDGAVISKGEGVSFIQVWDVGSIDGQSAWLETMRARVGALTGKPGFRYLQTHASLDGKRVVVYARWSDQASVEEAIGTPEAKAGHEPLREFGVPDGALYAVSEIFLPERTNHLREEVSKRWMGLGFETRMISVNGVDLFVAEKGAGRPALLLHGYPQSGEIWRFVAPELAKSRRVIVPDLRGMGISGVSGASYDLPSVAADVDALLDRLNLKDADVVGHDWGGAVAAVFALQCRSRVGKLVFIESAIGGAGFENVWRFDEPNPAMTFIPFLLTDGLAETLLHGREEEFLHHLWSVFTFNKTRVPFKEWRRYVDAMKRPGAVRAGASYYRAVYSAANAIRELIARGKLQIPVLSVSGSASFGASQRELVAAFADKVTRHVTIENAGHFIAEEQPEKLLAELQAFLNE